MKNTATALALLALLTACADVPIDPPGAGYTLTMPAPTDDPTFATDATYAEDGDAWSGAPNRVDPGAPVRAEGFEPGLIAAEHLNHVLGVHGDHIDWIRTVIAPPSVTVPIDVATPAIRRAYPEVDTQWDHVLSGSVWIWEATLANGLVFFPIRVPPGASLVSVSVRGKQVSSSNRLSFAISAYDLDSAETAAIQSETQDFGVSTATQTRTLTLPTPEAADSERLFYLRILAGSIGDEVYGAQVTYGYL